MGELFFSTTDLKGRIQKANRVFERIAAYTWAELSNKPHNIIRHPDMPRIVFRILWEHIQNGEPVVAFVKNLAHDGRYYWVVALVTPMPGGYLSVRFKPSSPLWNTVQNLYRDLRGIETRIEDESNDRKAGMEASCKALDFSLQQQGFAGYDDFMRRALKGEMQSRDAKLAVGGVPVHEPVHEYDTGKRSTKPESLITSAVLFDRLSAVLQQVFRDLDSYGEISQGVQEKVANVAEVSEALRVSALNGAIEADRLGTKAAGLRPVLDWLRELSAEITRQVASFAGALNELVLEVDRVVFDLSAARLQVEMTAFFASESAGSEATGRAPENDCMTDGAVGILHASSCETIRRGIGRLSAIHERLAVLAESLAKLMNSSHSLRPIYLTGKIEMAEGVGARLATVFQDVASHLDETNSNLTELRKILEDLALQLTRGLAHGHQAEAAIAEIDVHIGAIY